MMSFKHVLTRNVKKIPFDNIHSGWDFKNLGMYVYRVIFK